MADADQVSWSRQKARDAVVEWQRSPDELRLARVAAQALNTFIAASEFARVHSKS